MNMLESTLHSSVDKNMCTYMYVAHSYSYVSMFIPLLVLLLLVCMDKLCLNEMFATS
jgi:hypothetical protein